ncbi:MAG: signal recognition particle protein [Opitutae bacterium]|nr:signal recognition particle protein [Opitutae bacterium]|tara:strand:+ start:7972 stop:9357 length:1386 start_codon:yes stop_codon:yes gene_type:complete
MFESLTDKLSRTLRNIRGVGKLTEENVSEALGEVRKALLSADVHFRTAREFVDQVKEACLGQEVLKSVSPGQQVVKIIHDELIKLLGEGTTELREDRPLRVLMVGLHGAGKTTTSAKLAKRLAKDGRSPMLVACDVYRPAAIDQLEFLAKQEQFPCHLDRENKNVPAIARAGWEESKKNGSDVVIFDTAGRLQIDDDLVKELELLKKEVDPHEILLVADAALGQEAVNVAKTFHERLSLTGIVLTKVDGDARGGAALSMKKVTGTPIKFLGVGEKIDEFEVFHPDRLASRILGMGDVVSLVEKAQENLDQEESMRMAEKMLKAEFDFEDFLTQMRQMKKMGSMGSVAKMLPGMNNVDIGDKEESALGRHEAIILSMTKEERRVPRILAGSRRKRIADGAGVQIKDVNQLIKQFSQMQKMMKKMKGGKMKQMLSALGGGGGMPDMGDMDPKELAKLAKQFKG